MKKAIIIAFTTLMTLTATAGNPDGNNTDNTLAAEPLSEMEALFSVTGDDVVETAERFLGRPYRSGSKGPKAFDCSGFTSYVYKSLNIRLNNCSRSQYTEGVSVSRDGVHKGDLVFFGGSRNGGIGHVGIVYDVCDDGSFRFIHASSSRGVTISSSKEGYYAKRYKGARRILADYSDIASL